MKRLYLAVLMIFLLTFATGCSLNKAESNKPADKSTAVTAKADKPADKTGSVTGQEKKEVKNNNSSSIKNPSTVPQAGHINGAGRAVTLIITRDFGRQVLLKKAAAIENNSTVMDILKVNSDVITKYDGGYVSSIKGLESHNGGITGDNYDWFYYINGICSDAGADDYALKPGEIIWWDYHAWKSMGFVNSAVIGCYPEPFIHGYRGKAAAATVMASARNTALAAEMEKALKNQGASVNTVEPNNSLLEKRSHPTIVIGTWQELKQIEWLDNFNNAYKKTGTGVHFTDNSVELLDYHGNVTRTISGSGGIIATAGAGLGDAAPLWIIAGTDENGLQEALKVLVQNPGKISGFYSAAVIPGEIIRLPLQ